MTISSAVHHLAALAAEEASRRNIARHQAIAAASNLQWYVAHNGVASDERAINTLRRANFEVYYPLTEEFRTMRKRELSPKQRRSGIPIKRLRPVPLFPRYLFVNFDLSRDDWRDVFDLAGIHGILFAEDHGKALPAPIAEREVLGLMAKEVDGVIPGETPVAALYSVGEMVRISDGPLAGNTGTVDTPPNCSASDLDESAKVKLLVRLLGRACIVELPISDIEKL